MSTDDRVLFAIEDPDEELTHRVASPVRDGEEEFELHEFRSRSGTTTADDEATSIFDKDETKVYEFEGHTVVETSRNILSSRKLKLQVLTVYGSFIIFGLSDQTLGTIMQSLLDYYHIDRAVASRMFIFQIIGYFCASLLTGVSHDTFGFYGSYAVAQALQIVCYIVYSLRPPFYIMVLSSAINGYGVGTYDSACSLWVSSLDYSNEIMGVMHACFGLGAMISPFVITKLMHWGMPWNGYYLILAALVGLTLTGCLLFFREETKWKFKRRHAEASADPQGTTWDAMKSPIVWFFASTIFIYCGGELTVGVWLYNYYTTIKSFTDDASSYITSGYWMALTAGRFVLAFVTGRYFDGREHHATLLYAGVGALMCTLYASLGVFWVQMVCMMVFAFFVGPTYGTTVMVAVRRLPPSLQSVGVGFIAGVGGMGGTVVPYIVGYVSEHTAGGNGQGLKYFPALCALSFIIAFALWIGYFIALRPKAAAVAYERL